MRATACTQVQELETWIDNAVDVHGWMAPSVILEMMPRTGSLCELVIAIGSETQNDRITFTDAIPTRRSSRATPTTAESHDDPHPPAGVGGSLRLSYANLQVLPDTIWRITQRVELDLTL